MGRSSQEKAGENRQRILDAAARLFRTHGIDGVSIADVMRDCGLTVGGFYKHFTSKDDLAAQAVSGVFDQATASWQKVFDGADEREQSRVGTLVPQYLGNRRAERRCPLLAFAPHAAQGPADSDAALAYTAGAGRLFNQFLEDTRARGGDDAQAMVLFAAMVGYRVLEQAAGKTDWMRALEAAVNEKAASFDSAAPPDR
ncbi:TetR/AcrR family transcriptional regulator [Achromobacter veterisilvae]|uniref:TetR/AcrR family transcriptional regulator n=1 Tax=Achromobacter veterisilvae TaxID=2069367 RepID=A0ABZ2RUP1_9BURK